MFARTGTARLLPSVPALLPGITPGFSHNGMLRRLVKIIGMVIIVVRIVTRTARIENRIAKVLSGRSEYSGLLL